MKMIRFLANFYAVGGTGDSQVKYAQGETYPADDETLRQVAAGIAEEIDVPDAPSADHPTETGTTA
jgi:hypothetical protein